MVILADTKGFEALRCKSKKGSVTPMRMLIEHLPGLYDVIIAVAVVCKDRSADLQFRREELFWEGSLPYMEWEAFLLPPP